MSADDNALRLACASGEELARQLWAELDADARSELHWQQICRRIDHGSRPHRGGIDLDRAESARERLQLAGLIRDGRITAWGEFVLAMVQPAPEKDPLHSVELDVGREESSGELGVVIRFGARFEVMLDRHDARRVGTGVLSIADELDEHAAQKGPVVQ